MIHYSGALHRVYEYYADILVRIACFEQMLSRSRPVYFENNCDENMKD